MSEETRKRRMSKFNTEDFFTSVADGNESYENPIEITISPEGSKEDFADKQSKASTEVSTKVSDKPTKESSSKFWQDLRRKILFDLERHFKRKVDHDRLVSSLLYDFMFVQCFVVILFVAVWWGTWSNFDKLFDEIIFDGNTKLSSGVSLVIGVLGSICMISFQVELRQFSTNGGKIRMMLVSRIYTILRLYFDIFTWKGVFGIFDYIVDPLAKKPWYVPIFLHLSATFLLLCGGGYRTLIGTPVGIGIDRPSQYISVPTFQPQLQNNNISFKRRFLDALCTVGFGLIAVCSFYGIWSAEEVYFVERYDSTNDEARGQNAMNCVWIGHGGASAAFVLQFVSLYFHADSGKENKERSLITRMFSRFLHDFVLVVAFFAYVNLFRGYWYLLTTYFMPENQQTAHMLCQFYGIFLLFLLYCGTSLHGGVLLERQRYRYGILIPNFFLTYLLATKVESKQPCTFGKKITTNKPSNN